MQNTIPTFGGGFFDFSFFFSPFKGLTLCIWKFPGFRLNCRYTSWAYTTAIAMPDPSLIFDLCHSLCNARS